MGTPLESNQLEIALVDDGPANSLAMAVHQPYYNQVLLRTNLVSISTTRYNKRQTDCYNFRSSAPENGPIGVCSGFSVRWSNLREEG